MADNLKKFLDQAGVGILWNQIKAKIAADVKVEEDRAKGEEARIEGLVTAEVARADAAEKANAKAISDEATRAAGEEARIEGKVDAEVTRAKGEEARIEGLVTALDKDLVDGLAAAATALAEAVAAEEARAKLAEKANADAIDAHEAYVGEFTATEGVDTVVKYIDAKVAGVAGVANGIDGRVSAIEADYLTSADKTELSTAISDEAARAAGVEGGLADRIKAIEDDYLTSDDKTELQGNIDTLAGVVETLTDGIDPDKVDGVKDLIKYVEDHGPEVTGMKEDISDNADAIAAIEGVIGKEAEGEEAATGLIGDIAANAAAIATEKSRAEGVEAGLASRIKAVEDDYLKAVDKTELQGNIDKKVDQSAYDIKMGLLDGEDTAIKGRLDVIEEMLGDGEGSVADQIADAKAEAIEEAGKLADAAEEAANGYADGLNTAMNARVEALEAIDHEHANKALLDTYTQTEADLADAVLKKHAHANAEELDKIVVGDKAKWDAAAAIAHSHDNKSVLDGISAAKVAAWDAAETNANAYTDAEIAKIQALTKTEILTAIGA